MRDHEPIVLEEFNGLYKRGGADSVPQDHFSDCNNIEFIQSGFRWRDGIEPYLPYANILRIYTYVRELKESILVLTVGGKLYNTNSPTPFVPILEIPPTPTSTGMTDFSFVNIAGRAYIAPSNGEHGLAGEFLYVYNGGVSARKAAGDPPTGGSFAAANSGSPGNVEAGVHIFALVYETESGFLSALGPHPFVELTAPGGESVDLTDINISADPSVTQVHIVATKAIDPAFYTGDTSGYQFFFVPGAVVSNGTATLTVSFFDQDLLEDASHLIENFSEIPAGVALTTYHGRLVSVGEAVNISVARVSFPGEPEAISQVDGLIIAPLDGQPLTNAQEFRDVLYLFKQIRTFAYSDNGDVPSSWPLTVIDQGIGASIHGVGTVLDSGGVNIDYLQIVDYSGVMLFNGSYQRPELSWKIKDFWLALDRKFFKNIQIVNDSLNQKLYITLPNRQMLLGDYSNGLDAKNVRWTPWTFVNKTSTITLINTNELIIGSNAAS